MERETASHRLRWARLRFSIIGPLLAAPPEHGALQAELSRLADKRYRHPTTGQSIRFGASTLERWFYIAKNHPQDPVAALARKVPKHAGSHPSISVGLEQALRAQYAQHPGWSYQLHHDNAVALLEANPELGPAPSYPTMRRFMKASGMHKQRRGRKSRVRMPDAVEHVERETRSFEVEHVHALWHADFHVGSRRVLLPSGEYERAVLFAVLDDRSRLCCHAQWYLAESAEMFVHGLSQALLKRGLPRALLTDNGAAMTAAETTEGLERLGVLHYTTLPYSPQQNAKAEVFWAQVEGRLLAMLEGQRELTLQLLNYATQAWVEQDYHRRIHRELAQTPLSVATSAPSVVRSAPGAEDLRRAFRTEQTRKQRRSDGTLSVGGVRFELPSRYRTLLRPTVRFARWDLSTLDLVDARTGKRLCGLYPLDKAANADRRRRVVPPPSASELAEHDGSEDRETGGIAPHLAKLMSEYAATGIPPAYLPHVASTPNADERGDDSNLSNPEPNHDDHEEDTQ